MVKVCVVCHEYKEAETHFAEGWACAVCTRTASTIVSVYVIRGQKFHKLLKGVEVKNETAPAGTEAVIRKEAKAR